MGGGGLTLKTRIRGFFDTLFFTVFFCHIDITQGCFFAYNSIDDVYITVLQILCLLYKQIDGSVQVIVQLRARTCNDGPISLKRLNWAQIRANRLNGAHID